MAGHDRYTCQDLRMEMIILGLRRRLQDTTLDDREREEIRARLHELEAAAGLD